MRMKSLMALAACVFAAGGLIAVGPAQATTLTGQWNNTSYTSTGPLTLDIEVAAPNISITLDADGFVYGNPAGAPPVVFNGTINPGGSVDINIVDDPFFGDIVGTIDPAGNLDIVATDSPQGVFKLTVTGTLTTVQFNGNYQVDFVDLSQINDPVERTHFALGTFNAVPEPASLALLLLGGLMIARRRRD